MSELGKNVEGFNAGVSVETFKPLTPTEEQIIMMEEARYNLVLGSSLFGYLLPKCRIIFSELNETAFAVVTTKENIIGFNPKFFCEDLTTTQERSFVLLHEIRHIFNHTASRELECGYDTEIWGYATDYNINLLNAGVYLDERENIAQDPHYKAHFHFPKFGGLYDEAYVGMSCDDIYRALVEEINERGGEGDGGSDGSSGSPKAVNTKGGRACVLDEVSDLSTGDQTFATDLASEQVAANMQALMEAATFAESTKSVGKCEGGVVAAIKKMAVSRVSWRDRLAAIVNTTNKISPSYSRQNRRNTGRRGDPYFPAYFGTGINIIYGGDTSGSMDMETDHAIVIGELAGILDTFEDWKVDYVSCDVKLTHNGLYSSEDGDDASSIKMEITGLGGTDMSMIAKYAVERHEEEPEFDTCIIVTDGYLGADDIARLDATFVSSMQNIVITTRNRIELKNAEVIHMQDL